MSWEDDPKGTLSWLLEKDSPAVRYLALRDLLGCTQEDADLRAARRAAHRQGPIAFILDAMDAAGYWVGPGPGYNPKYRSTVWSVLLLAQLGASPQEDRRVSTACGYVLEHALTPGGQFSMSGAPSGTVDCLQGNLCWALRELGVDDPRLEKAFEWMAHSVTGEGIASPDDRQASVRYYAAKCGPGFACGANDRLPCAWGAVKVMLAFGKWPRSRRTPAVEGAIRQGIDFLLGVDPAEATYPSGTSGKPSRNWWKFGFPLFYVTDLLQLVEALASLGCGRDPRLAHALALAQEKQDSAGRWTLEYDYAGKTWVDFGAKRQPNKWVTLRAVRVLQAAAVG